MYSNLFGNVFFLGVKRLFKEDKQLFGILESFSHHRAFAITSFAYRQLELNLGAANNFICLHSPHVIGQPQQTQNLSSNSHLQSINVVIQTEVAFNDLTPAMKSRSSCLF